MFKTYPQPYLYVSQSEHGIIVYSFLVLVLPLMFSLTFIDIKMRGNKQIDKKNKKVTLCRNSSNTQYKITERGEIDTP
jgi:low temperature requirement protein LtrA